MTQQIIIYIIIAAAVLSAVKWVADTIRNAKKGNAACAGCPLAEACNAKNKRKCPNIETNNKKDA
jgi:hypothetical protein